jgi:hypothetical protein
MPPEYHLIARVDGDAIRVSTLLNRAKPPRTPTTSLNFRPVSSDPAQYLVTVYWKSDLPDEMTAVAERVILEYCARLYNESAYSGPIDCCL